MSHKRPPSAPTVTLTAEDDAALQAATRHIELPTRYVDLGVIGQGGMGVVRRVFDQVLRRTLAMKLIRPERAQQRRARLRFLREAQITAGLHHPGIVAVHDQGSLRDGRLWYTMQAVEGVTLADIITTTPRRRLITILAQVARAVGSAHRQSILHRDLKPSNLMIGEFGEVLVLDWGIAIRTDEAVESARVGTPAYMPPEQAAGERLAPPSDVYALGAILHEILTGEPPHAGVAVGLSPLGQTCRRALSVDPNARFADGLLFAEALQAWLDGAERRAAAQQIFAQAKVLLTPIAAARAAAEALSREADAILAPLPPHAPVSRKQPGWRLARRARDKAREARLLEVELVQKARAALEQDETFTEPRAMLADLYRDRVIAAEAARDADAAAENMALLKAQDDGRHTEWIAGNGRMTLHIAAQAHLTMRRIEERDRRLVPTDVVIDGPAPWIDVELERGNYLVEVAPIDGAAFVVPVHIERGMHWQAGPPTEQDRPLHVPRRLDPSEVYVPAGWYVCGGDRRAVDSFDRRRIWVDSFVMKRHPVTNAEYLAFLNDLVASDRAAEAQRHCPRQVRSVSDDEPYIYARDGDGYFAAPSDAGGEEWLPNHPVVSIDWASAVAYTAWRSAQDGLEWRLPHALEWEKAARGTDGRSFPWGDYFEPTWTCVVQSVRGPPRRVAVESLAADRSPYGVLGMAGNCRDWCLNAYMRRAPDDGSVLIIRAEPTAQFRAARGGSAHSRDYLCRVAARFGAPPDQRRSSLGFRLVRACARPQTSGQPAR